MNVFFKFCILTYWTNNILSLANMPSHVHMSCMCTLHIWCCWAHPHWMHPAHADDSLHVNTQMWKSNLCTVCLRVSFQIWCMWHSVFCSFILWWLHCNMWLVWKLKASTVEFRMLLLRGWMIFFLESYKVTKCESNVSKEGGKWAADVYVGTDMNIY